MVRRARAKAAPGPSGISYKVYKNCPRLLQRLCKLLRTIWKKKKLPKTWTLAEGCFVPKEDQSRTLNQFREISLLDVEAKIFWAVIAKRLTNFLLTNKYIDPSVQKGGIPGHSGCLEHTASITQLIKEAKEGKTTLSAIWLDLAKAYPSVPHQLIKEALGHYHVPQEVTDLTMEHLGSLQMRFTVGKVTTGWQRLEKGIMAGCTVSVILFVAAMNMLLKAGEKQCRGPKAVDGTRHPPCRAFMDDITVMTSSITGTRWILTALEKMANWARMVFKPAKSRSLSIEKGVLTKQHFQIQGEVIPTIQGERIKCLGKYFDETLKDVHNATEVVEELKRWLKVIEGSHLQGRFKAWCFQFGVIPRLQWPFLLYDIPISKVEAMERLCSRFIRKWMGVPPSFSSVNLYCKGSKLVLPISSVAEEFKATKVRAVTTLRTSKDGKVQKAGEAIRCGRKWKPQEAATSAIEDLKQQEMIGIVCKGRQGLGNYGSQLWSKADPKTKRNLVVQQVRRTEERERQVKAVGLASQGRWMAWEPALDRKLTWKELWAMDQGKLSFILRATADLLPTPSNLRIWGKEENAACKLCNKANCTLNHILSSCPKALGDGRYRWRHDKVLQEIAVWVDLERLQANKEEASLQHPIPFMKEGQKMPSKPKKSQKGYSILARARDWEIQVDLRKKLVFPEEVAVTRLRPDMVLLSRSSKSILIVELTVPWEERLDISHQLKKAKYQDLVDEAHLKGWHAVQFPIEIGCRGFPGKSLRFFFQQLGLPPSKTKKAVKAIGAAAESSSRWLWLRRGDMWSHSTGEG